MGTVIREFLWARWIKDFCKWLTTGFIFIVIDKIAMQNVISDDTILKTIGLVGQVGYFGLCGAGLVVRDNPYYYRFHERNNPSTPEAKSYTATADD